MNTTKILKSTAFLCCFVFILMSFNSCEKYECKGIIRTFTTDLAGNKTPVRCNLEIGDPSYDTSVYRLVVTDANGYYEGIWKNEVTLTIKAIGTVGTTTLQGSGKITLLAGETSDVEILLN